MDVTPLIEAADTNILLVVMDGLGGYADGEHGTELEEATTPHLDQLAAEGTTGLVEPVGPGITPGCSPWPCSGSPRRCPPSFISCATPGPTTPTSDLKTVVSGTSVD